MVDNIIFVSSWQHIYQTTENKEKAIKSHKVYSYLNHEDYSYMPRKGKKSQFEKLSILNYKPHTDFSPPKLLCKGCNPFSSAGHHTAMCKTSDQSPTVKTSQSKCISVIFLTATLRFNGYQIVYVDIFVIINW